MTDKLAEALRLAEDIVYLHNEVGVPMGHAAGDSLPLAEALLSLAADHAKLVEAVRAWQLVMGMEHDGSVAAFHRDEAVCQELLRVIRALGAKS